jgi:hypothetical protein
MDDFGRIVKQAADAVATEIADDAVAVLFGKALDGMRNIAECIACACLLNPAHHRLIGHLDQPLRFDRHVADQIRPVGIAVPAVDNRRHINVHDIALTQCFCRRNAVADDMVD